MHTQVPTVNCDDVVIVMMNIFTLCELLINLLKENVLVMLNIIEFEYSLLLIVF